MDFRTTALSLPLLALLASCSSTPLVTYETTIRRDEGPSTKRTIVVYSDGRVDVGTNGLMMPYRATREQMEALRAALEVVERSPGPYSCPGGKATTAYPPAYGFSLRLRDGTLVTPPPRCASLPVQLNRLLTAIYAIHQEQ